MKLNKAALGKVFSATTDDVKYTYVFDSLEGTIEADHFKAGAKIAAVKGDSQAVWKHNWANDSSSDSIRGSKDILPENEDDRLVLIGELIGDYLKQTGADDQAVKAFFDLSLTLEKGQLKEID